MMSPRPTPPQTPLTPRHRPTRSIASRFPSIFTTQPKSPSHSATSSASSISTLTSVSSTSSEDVNKSLLPTRSGRWGKDEEEEEDEKRLWSRRRVRWWRSRRGVIVIALWVGAVVVIGWFGVELSRGTEGRLEGWRQVFSTSSSPTVQMELVEVTDEQLEAVPVTRKDGSMGWSFELPEQLSGLLKAEQYGKMCKSAGNMPGKLHAVHTADGGHAHASGHSHRDYYWADPEFFDPDNRTSVGEAPEEICASSLTYQLSENDVSMGSVLMGMWLAYGMAQREHRAFFVDDSNWAYGSYATYFTLPPAPSCRPPPANWILPCPRTAQHLIMTSTTAHHNFGHGFVEEYEDPRGMDTLRQVRIFALARSGYDALFRPSQDILRIAQKRLGKIDVEWKGKQGLPMVVQVRRGEIHPYRFKERFAYIPVEEYVELARNISDSSEKLLMMSDSLEAVESLGYPLAGEGTKFTPPRMGPPSHEDDETDVQRMFVNGPGFYAKTFRALEQEGREMWGASFVLDLTIAAMVLDSGSEASVGAGVVCGLKSYMCRLLAVVLGWEKGILENRWRNIDGQWGWRGWEW